MPKPTELYVERRAHVLPVIAQSTQVQGSSAANSQPLPFVVSDATLADHNAVLRRPKLCTLKGLSAAEIDTFLTDLARHAIVLNPPNTVTAPIAPDVDDPYLWDLLAIRPDLMLVTVYKLLL